MTYKIFLFISLFIFIPFSAVFATSQLLDNTSQVWGWNNTGSWQYWCQSFVAEESEVSKVYLKAGRNNDCPTTPYELQICISEQRGYCAPANNIIAEKVYSQAECETLLPDGSYSEVEVDFGEYSSLTIGNTYYLCAYSGSFMFNEWGTIRKQNTDVYANGVLDYYDGSWKSDSSDLYFQIETGAPTENIIIYPQEDSFLPINTSITFYGNCIENGTTTMMLWDHNNGYQSLTCSDHTWSLPIIETEADTNRYELEESCEWIVDEYICQFADDVWVNWVSSTTTSGYLIEIVSPNYTGDQYFKRQPSDDAEFKFRYTLPSFTLSSSTMITIEKYDENWQNVISTLANNNIDYLDVELDNQFTVGGFEASSTALTYYRALVWDYNTVDHKYTLYWYIDGSGDSSTPAAAVPSDSDFGLWGNLFRSLFVPDTRFMRDYVQDIPNKLATVIPFYYYYQVKGQIEGLAVASSSDFIANFDVDVAGEHLEVPFIDTSLEGVDDFTNGIRPFLVYGLWILFIMYILNRIFDFQEL